MNRGIFGWIGGKLYGGASSLYKWLNGSTVGSIVKTIAIETIAYQAYYWWIDSNDELLEELIAEECVPYLALSHTRPEMIAKLRPLLDNSKDINKFMNDKLRLGHIISLYCSAQSSSTLGLTTIARTWIDNVTEGMIESISENEDASTEMTDEQTTELSEKFRLMAGKMIRFLYMISTPDEKMLEIKSISLLLTTAIELCYSSPYYSEWKDGDLRGVGMMQTTASPIMFFSVIADLNEIGDRHIEHDLVYLFGTFNSMYLSSPIRTQKKGVNWKYFISTMCLNAFREYVMMGGGDNEE